MITIIIIKIVIMILIIIIIIIIMTILIRHDHNKTILNQTSIFDISIGLIGTKNDFIEFL